MTKYKKGMSYKIGIPFSLSLSDFVFFLYSKSAPSLFGKYV